MLRDFGISLSYSVRRYVYLFIFTIFATHTQYKRTQHSHRAGHTHQRKSRAILYFQSSRNLIPKNDTKQKGQKLPKIKSTHTTFVNNLKLSFKYYAAQSSSASHFNTNSKANLFYTSSSSYVKNFVLLFPFKMQGNVIIITHKQRTDFNFGFSFCVFVFDSSCLQCLVHIYEHAYTV